MTAGLLVSHADSIFCPAEIKEIKEIFIPIGEALSALSAISAISSTRSGKADDCGTLKIRVQEKICEICEICEILVKENLSAFFVSLRLNQK